MHSPGTWYHTMAPNTWYHTMGHGQGPLPTIGIIMALTVALMVVLAMAAHRLRKQPSQQ
jgi:hypothetical protein